MDKIRIAFDCMGTLDNPQDTREEARIVKLFRWFQSKGCHMVVWSSDYDLAVETNKRHNLNADEVVRKYSWVDANNQGMPYMTIKVDDQKQDYLAAANTIYVRHVWDDSEEFFEEHFGDAVKPSTYQERAAEDLEKLQKAQALIREVEFGYASGHPFRALLYRGIVNTFSVTGNEISHAMVQLQERIKVGPALKEVQCDRCQEWNQMGLSDTCPGCDMLEEPSEVTEG